jgi:hypothetical protein
MGEIMLENQYALIKNNTVVNVIVIEDKELIQKFVEEFNADDAILADTKSIIGSTWNGEKFTLPKPESNPSFILVDNEWVTPTPYPLDGLDYQWDEAGVQWIPIAE